jgi:hypothetical protein
MPGFEVELLYLLTLFLTLFRSFTAFAAIIHTRLTATLCTPGAMVHFTITAWGIGRGESKRGN